MLLTTITSCVNVIHYNFILCPATRLVGPLTQPCYAIVPSHTFKVNSFDIFLSGYKSTVWACTLTHLSNVVRNFIVSGRMKPEEAVVAILSSLPDEVVDTVGTVLPSEDSVSERRKKLEFLEMQEELIKVMYMSSPYRSITNIKNGLFLHHLQMQP